MARARFFASLSFAVGVARSAELSEAQRTTRVSVDSTGVQGNLGSDYPSMSSDSRFVAFHSNASNLVPGDTNGTGDIFVHDRRTGETSRVSVDSAGGQGNSSSYNPSISADGRFVAFWSPATNLVPGDTNGSPDIFVHNRQTGETTRVSVDSTGGQGNGGSSIPSISAEGRFVTFQSVASNLVPGDSNRHSDAFVHDRQTEETIRVSVDSAGVQGNSSSDNPSISADGRFVAFESLASNLVHTVPGDTNGSIDIFVHDRLTAETTRVSVDSAGVQGNSFSDHPSSSGDGRFVAFRSDASSLVPADTNGTFDVFVRYLIQVGLTSVVPAVGSEGGNDFVHLYGRGFTEIADTTVSFASAAATVVSVAPDRIDVRTPPGRRVAPVAITNSFGTATLQSAFTYVAPELAARYGNVNVGRGDRENVLLVNATAGDTLNRDVNIGLNEPISVVMLSPSSRSSARFALYGWAGAPSAATIRVQPAGVGTMTFPTPLNAGASPQPVKIGNNLDPRLGAANFPTTPAPSLLVRRGRGVARPLVATLQGFIQDTGSQIPQRVSITNAAIVRVQ